MDPVTIGIDVSKATLTIAVLPSGETWTSETTPTRGRRAGDAAAGAAADRRRGRSDGRL